MSDRAATLRPHTPNTTRSDRSWGPRRIALTRAAFYVGPLCMLVYGAVRLSAPEHRPDLSWTVGHLAMTLGVLLFGAVFAGLRRLVEPAGAAGRRSARAATALGLIGVLAVTAQGVIDIVVGLRAADKPAMKELFEQVQSQPGVMPAVYTVGPMLFYVGLIWLVAQLAVARRIAAWRPVAVVLAVAAMAVSLDLIPLGAALFCVALSPLARALTTPATAAR
ncbi:hypothetical protein ACFWAR_31330 [Streptomyces sp. NPDC059917]|uniref:hypothetical protein n=1 Tax=Streptomyces sp. NPDC059917 TaxID=3347002 RepID=UPI00364C0FB2